MGTIRWGKDPPGNLFHAALVVLCAALLLARRRRTRGLNVYGLCLLAATLLFCLLVKYQIGIPRLQLPLFVLAAPWAALVLERALSSRLAMGLAALGLVLAGQWIGFSESCPLVGPESVFRKPRSETAYRWSAHLAYPIRSIARATGASGAEVVGLVSDGSFLEYYLWRELRAHHETMPRLENLSADGHGEPLPVAQTVAPPELVVWWWAGRRAPDEVVIQDRSYGLEARWDWTPYALYRRFD